MTPILNHYFARINWLGAAAANIDTLRALHLKHNCTIPFENLDVLLPREIQLDDQSLEDKLVIARRGGYCFEQNGVFERVLRAPIVCCWWNWKGKNGLLMSVSVGRR